MENEEVRPKKIMANIEPLADGVIINQQQYTLVDNYRDAFDFKQFSERYSDILSQYDYIVGDIGYEQLRLRGFFYEDNKEAPMEWKITSLSDYLFEYCNFGCPYFVLERRTGEVGRYTKKTSTKKKTYPSKKQTAHVSEKRGKLKRKSMKVKERGKR